MKYLLNHNDLLAERSCFSVFAERRIVADPPLLTHSQCEVPTPGNVFIALKRGHISAEIPNPERSEQMRPRDGYPTRRNAVETRPYRPAEHSGARPLRRR